MCLGLLGVPLVAIAFEVFCVCFNPRIGHLVFLYLWTPAGSIFWGMPSDVSWTSGVLGCVAFPHPRMGRLVFVHL